MFTFTDGHVLRTGVLAKVEATPDPLQVLYSEGQITYDELQERLARRGGDFQGAVRSLIPARYGDVKTSGIQVEVKARMQNEFNFDLVD